MTARGTLPTSIVVQKSQHLSLGAHAWPAAGAFCQQRRRRGAYITSQIQILMFAKG
jgi:hypothetical protein